MTGLFKRQGNTLQPKISHAKKPRAHRICVVYPGSFPSLGGAEILAYELAKSLAKENYVLVACQSSDYSSEQPEFGNKPKNLCITPVLKKGKIGIVKNFFAIFKLLLRERVDVVHAHYVFPAATWGIVGKLFGASVLVTSHGADVQKNKDIGYGMRLNKVISAITWFTLKLIDVHIVVSKSMINDAMEAGSNPSKIRVIYNGIDFEINTSSRKTDILQRNGLAQKDFIILYLGRLHPKKCPDDLVKALPRVTQEVPNAKLIFAGKGEEEMKLKKLSIKLGLGKKVVFTGFVSEDEKWDLLKNCKIFVLPSVVEAFGIAVIEAMICGKPVVATNIGPFPEIIRDGETGMIVPVNSPERIADAIIYLASDDNRRSEIGKRAKEDVQTRFDINKIANDYMRCIKMIEKKRGR